MDKVYLAAITIGQSPRVDMTGDMLELLSDNIELIEYGALDKYSYEEAERSFSPLEDDDVLVTRMRDGSQIRLAEKHVVPLIQDCISRAEKDGVSGIILLCTGKFPKFAHEKLLIIPQPIFQSTAEKLAGGTRVGVIVPDKAQEEQVAKWWKLSGVETEVASGSPYLGMNEVEDAARRLEGKDVSFICLDCMGYTVEMKNRVAEITGKPVILPRTLVARIADELYTSCK
jgi:protein AroM